VCLKGVKVAIAVQQGKAPGDGKGINDPHLRTAPRAGCSSPLLTAACPAGTGPVPALSTGPVCAAPLR
jgi:hypothetical protein